MGGTEEISVNVRLVVATNRNLPKMVREGKFRADLYQRLSTIVINIAPLREHKEDVAEIADGFWMDMFGCHLSKDQCEALAEYDYPGNVRELINILDRARALEEDDFRKLIKEHREINRELWSSDGSESTGEYPDDLEKTIRMHTKAVFKKYGGNLSAAREALGISVNTLKKYLAS